MERRDFPRAGAALGVAGPAGCTGMFETRSANAPPPVVVVRRHDAEDFFRERGSQAFLRP